MRKQALNEKINTSNMTRLRLLVICFLEIIFSCLLITGHTRSSPPLLEKHVALFIFSDSLFDAGNNNYINTTTNFQANFLPYGETFFKYPTGRFSDGRIIPDFIVFRVTIDSNIFAIHKPRITHGVNFASSGADALTETHQGLVIDLQTQLSNFKIVEEQLKKKPGDAAAKTLASNAVYLIDGGGNDYFVALTTNSSVLQETICGYGHRQSNDYNQAINTGGSSIAHNQPTWPSPATNASDGTNTIAAIAATS
ncbi:hypothetical protein WN943_022082 [Citrus x changshan-huyou]